MYSRAIFVGCALMLGVVADAEEPAAADPPVELTAAYNAYREAMDEMGFVRDPSVVQSGALWERGGIGTDYDGDFEAAAIDAAEKFRYAPKFVEGKPVAVEGIRNRIIFEMRN